MEATDRDSYFWCQLLCTTSGDCYVSVFKAKNTKTYAVDKKIRNDASRQQKGDEHAVR